MTAIPYVIYKPGQVTLKVYDLLGREIALLSEGYKEAGTYQVFWNGTDKEGSRISSGIYLYRLSAGGKEKTKRMTLVR